MSSRIAVLTGLLAGILSAVLLMAGLVAFAPQLSDTLGLNGPVVIGPTPGPSGAVPSITAPPSARPTAGATAGPSASPGDSAEPSDAVPTDEPTGSGASARPTLAPRSPIPGAFHVGEPAPKLVLPLLGGGTFDLAKLKGKPVWVNFMGTYCPPCRDEFPVMSGFQARYADDGLTVIAVDVREDTSTIQEFVGSTGATFSVALDKDGAAQRTWGAVALPVHFWIGADGIVKDGALGGIGPDQMAQSLALILPGVNVTP
jgi:cytochrome c biogenesis protein CcmG, thiol:disulfide interchange protein DsbE